MERRYRPISSEVPRDLLVGALASGAILIGAVLLRTNDKQIGIVPEPTPHNINTGGDVEIQTGQASPKQVELGISSDSQTGENPVPGSNNR